MKRKNSQSGYILIASLAIAAILLTVGLSLTQLSTQDITSTKAEEDAKRARAAAEAGIEEALRTNDDVNISNIMRGGSDITGEAVILEEESPTFITPLISKDGQYAFYLADYDSTDNTFEGAFSSNITIDLVEPSVEEPLEDNLCDDGDESNDLAVELIFINYSSKTAKRYKIDPCNIMSESTESEEEFGVEITASGPEDFHSAHLLVAYVIAPSDDFSGAKLQFTRMAGGDFPVQGRMITSTAQTAGNITKTIKLFQSYPQIPSEFLMLRF